MSDQQKIPRWVRVVLFAAGLNSICWGVYVCVWPKAIFEHLLMPIPTYLSFWQYIGLMVGLYGFLYIVAAIDPIRYRVFIIIGLASKILGPIGFFLALQRGEFPWSVAWIVVLNDVIWWLPLYVVLLQGVRESGSSDS